VRLSLIDRIEFREIKKRGYKVPLTEVSFYVKDLEAFIKWCCVDKFNQRMWTWNIERANKSRAKKPKFEMHIQGKRVHVYPQEKLVVSYEGTLHYVCQHSFDINPYGIRECFYDRIAKNEIGYLFTRKGEKLLVRSDDIDIGFLLTYEQCKEYKDNFTNWIQYRRSKE